jgi:hypothetical protein
MLRGGPVDRLSDEPSVARYTALQSVLGEPRSKAQADVLVLLSSWMADEEAAALAELVRQATGAATERYRDLVAEIAHQLDRTHPASVEGWTYTAMPTILAATIRDAAREDQQPASPGGECN